MKSPYKYRKHSCASLVPCEAATAVRSVHELPIACYLGCLDSCALLPVWASCVWRVTGHILWDTAVKRTVFLLWKEALGFIAWSVLNLHCNWKGSEKWHLSSLWPGLDFVLLLSCNRDLPNDFGHHTHTHTHTNPGRLEFTPAVEPFHYVFFVCMLQLLNMWSLQFGDVVLFSPTWC